jgi:two-component system, LuxR family, response regulator FixJ
VRSKGEYNMPENHTAPEILVADDDPLVCDLLDCMLTSGGFRVTTFGDGRALLAAARARVPACIILDVYLPGKTGLDILRELDAQRYPAPVILISGNCQTSMVVDAVKHGALDVIEKPFQPDTMLARVRDAVSGRLVRGANGAANLPASFPGRYLLTSRELEVLTQIAAGAPNKDIARNLGISTRTVEVHRAHIIDKLGARNTADLMRRVLSERDNNGL